jgi:glycine/D-amino acid oxidase-like deaminating enzyme
VLLARFAEEVEMLRHIRDNIRTARPNIALELWDAEKCQQETHSKLYIGGLYQPSAGQFVPPGFVRGVAAEAQKLGLSKWH